jgi:serine/threonine protein kinase
MSVSRVIGEGTYGCVHKPSLTCKRKKINYENKISKVMKTKEAAIELNEYKNIAKVDENKDFYLGNPIKCAMNIKNANLRSVEKCKNADTLLKQLDQVSLLVMNDGGITMEEFADKVEKMHDNPDNVEKIERFWIEVHRLFRGLKVFIDNGIVHHDLKPQNIVYNEETHRLNFIDFGLMTSKKNIIKKTAKSDYYLAKYHWSYPFEIRFMNKKKYLDFVQKTEKEKQEYYTDIIAGFDAKEDVSSTNAMRTFFYFISKPKHSHNENETMLTLFFEDFYRMLVHELNDKHKYREFLEKCIDTIDIYGTGIGLFYVLSRSLHLLPKRMIEELTELCYFMVTPDLNKRFTIDMVLNRYELILKDSGLLNKYNIHFENHQIIEGISIPPAVNQDIQSIKREHLAISETDRNNVVFANNKVCPPGKEYKNTTRRCVNICKEGYVRNAAFKCVKNKTAKKRA